MTPKLFNHEALVPGHNHSMEWFHNYNTTGDYSFFSGIKRIIQKTYLTSALLLCSLGFVYGCPEPADDNTYEDDDITDDDDSTEENEAPYGTIDLELDEPLLSPTSIEATIEFTDPDTSLEDMLTANFEIIKDEITYININLKTTEDLQNLGDNTYQFIFIDSLEAGNYVFKLSLNDGYNDPFTTEETLEIIQNEAPILEDADTLEFMVRQNTEQRIYFTDSNNGQDSHEAIVTGLPGWVNNYGVDQGGNFVWLEGTADNNAWEEGTYNFSVLLTDLKGASDEKVYALEAVAAGTAVINVTAVSPVVPQIDPDAVVGADVEVLCGSDYQIGQTDANGDLELLLNETGTECRVIATANGHTTYDTNECETPTDCAHDVSEDVIVQLLRNDPTDADINEAFDNDAPYMQDAVLYAHGLKIVGLGDSGVRTFERYEEGPLSAPIKYFVTDEHENGTTLTQQQYDDLVDVVEEGADIINANSYGVTYLEKTEDPVQAIMTVRAGELNISSSLATNKIIYDVLITLDDGGLDGRTAGEEFANMLGVEDIPAAYQLTNGWTELSEFESDLLYTIHMSEYQDQMDRFLE